MRKYELPRFGLDHLRIVDAPAPTAGPHQVVVRVHAVSPNFRDVLVVEGQYNPRLKLPCTPMSDAAGVVESIGPEVSRVKVGDLVMTHFVADWLDGPYQGRYLGSTLGTPGPGVAAELIVVPQDPLVPIPAHLSLAEAATLPIAALTAWSALVTEGKLARGQTMLTLGTGGVSIFALQIAKAIGARCIITSSSDQKLMRAKELGADATINYSRHQEWEKQVLEYTENHGADVVVENGGVGTLGQSLRAVRPGGVIAMLGALTGLEGKVNLAPVLMKRVRIAGILVDSRASFLSMRQFFEQHRIQPVIDSRFSFDQLRAALKHLKDGKHFGKIVVDVEPAEAI